MKYIILILIILSFNSCLNFKENPESRLHIEQKDIKSVYLICNNDSIKIESTDLISKINSAKSIGLIKGIVRNNLIVCLKNNDTIQIRLIDNQFKWNKSADWTYELNIEKDYFNKICTTHYEKIDSLLEIVTLKNCRISDLTVPKGWSKTEKYDYTEGNVQTFYYSDKSFITVICGSLMNFETPEKKQVDKFWRQEKILGKMIIYGNVTKERKMIFDRAFDKTKVSKKTMIEKASA